MTEQVIDLTTGNSADVETTEMEIVVDEAVGWTSGTGTVHNDLSGREWSNQHPIVSIIGLKNKLEEEKTLKTVYSDKVGFANYYKWDSGAYDDYGYFVSLASGDTIKICDGTDIFGVTVDNAAFVGGQLEVISEETDEYGMPKHLYTTDNTYALVATSGLVDVRCASDVEVGNYVVAHDGIAVATESGCGYKVSAVNYKETPTGEVLFATISLGVQACTTDVLGQRVLRLETDMDNAALDIAAVMDLATQACAMAGSSNTTSDETKEKVDHVIDAVDRIQGEMDSTREDLDKSKIDINDAILAAESEADQAVTIANNALANVNNLIDKIEPIDEWVDPATGKVGAEYVVRYMDENGLSTKEEVQVVESTAEDNKSWIRHNGQNIEMAVSSVDKYSVGAHSQAYGLTLQQAGDILKEGMIYIPIADETFFEEYVYGVDEEGNKKIYKKPFTPTTYYYEWKKIELFVDEVSIGYHYMWDDCNGKVGKLAQPPALSDFHYWYPNVDTIAEGYEKYKPKTLYVKQETTDENGDAVIEWIEVATLAGNVNNRITSIIRQDVDSVTTEIVNARGGGLSLNDRLTDTDAAIENNAFWKKDDGTEYVAAFRQVAGEGENEGASLTLVAYRTDKNGNNEEKIDLASFTVGTTEDGTSYIDFKADNINLSSEQITAIADQVTVDAKDITINGSTTFATEVDGVTKIEGGNIATKSITADAIDVDDLSALEATIGGWTIESDGIYKDSTRLLTGNELYASVVDDSPKSPARISVGEQLAIAEKITERYVGTIPHGIKAEYDAGNGVLTDGAGVAIYQEYVDDDQTGYTGITDGREDFSHYGYLLNNDGVLTLVLYKGADDKYQEPDLREPFFYEGRATVDGVEYDKWRKIVNPGAGGGDLDIYTWTSTAKQYAYTNIIVCDQSAFSVEYETQYNQITNVSVVAVCQDERVDLHVATDGVSWENGVINIEIEIGDHSIIGYGVGYFLYIQYTPIDVAPFLVLEDGSLYANAANISGTIKANGGQIGGWDIDEDSIIGNGVHLYSGDEYRAESLLEPNRKSPVRFAGGVSERSIEEPISTKVYLTYQDDENTYCQFEFKIPVEDGYKIDDVYIDPQHNGITADYSQEFTYTITFKDGVPYGINGSTYDERILTFELAPGAVVDAKWEDSSGAGKISILQLSATKWLIDIGSVASTSDVTRDHKLIVTTIEPRYVEFSGEEKTGFWPNDDNSITISCGDIPADIVSDIYECQCYFIVSKTPTFEKAIETAPFKVLEDGSAYIGSADINSTIYATNSVIQGEIIANKGSIGQCTIDDNGLSLTDSDAKIRVGLTEISTDGTGGKIIAKGSFSIEGANGTKMDLMVSDGTTERVQSSVVLRCQRLRAATPYHKFKVYAETTTGATLYDVSFDVDWQLIYQYYSTTKVVKSGTISFTIKAGDTQSEQKIIDQYATDASRICGIQFRNYYNDVWEWSNTVCWGLSSEASDFEYTNAVYYFDQYKSNNNIVITGNLIPSTNSTGVDSGYDLGGEGCKWKTVWAHNGQIQTSDEKAKKNIEPLDDKYGVMFDNLRPISYQFNVSDSNRTHTGISAQNTKAAIECAGLTTNDFAGYCEWINANGDVECGLRYDEFISLCIDQIQKLKKRVEELEKLNNETK